MYKKTSVCTQTIHPCKVASLRTMRKSVRVNEIEGESESKKLKSSWKTQGYNNNSGSSSRSSSWCASKYEDIEFSPIGILKAALVVVAVKQQYPNYIRMHVHHAECAQNIWNAADIKKTAQRGKYQKWKTTKQLQLESCDLMTFFFLLFFLTKFVDHYHYLHTYTTSRVECVCTQAYNKHINRHK